MKSLYVKFVVMTLGIMILSFFIAFVVSNAYYQYNLKDSNDEKNTEIATEVASFIEANPKVSLEEYLTTIADAGYQMYLADGNNNEQFFGADFNNHNLSSDVVGSVLNGKIYHGMANFEAEIFVTGFFANELSNTIGVPVEHDGISYALFMRPDINLLFNEMHLLFGLLFMLTVILSIVLVFISAHFLIKPVTKLSEATKLLAAGDYSVHDLDTNRRDELGELSSNFARMSRQIEYSDKIQKDFISNISHDIQSPLSSIKGYNKLLNKPLTAAERSEYTETVDFEIDRLSTMTEQLLILSSIDHEDYLLRKESYNLREQLERLIKVYEWKINEKGLMLSHKLQDTEIMADKALMNTVWDNLLSNAVKYNGDAGSIDIEMTRYKAHTVIRISDTGEGIDTVSIDKIFDRFYRVDTARTSSVGGTGLGLSIVKKILELHNGSINVRSSENGTVFTVRLPVDTEE
ncbi:two-component sensor histidine kinase [Jeotgalicoccus coquinae]|uniref:Heme sensor protein HssS n=1 Tax=Jeotgalicoccus coquinae TaxID=709509 RepID=A0A6V7R3B4_9STAP|nr:HAMP domain-containing sensor histidine kinase [Jeotgalicoccus coquinae]MBB6423512.1 signal transduction histidine kinase [Jeotgalicoccus coquinae]GGE20399.1 two-component sensor histidine kinase [Jeotgalicoccus coquinae]CAD2071554.1 Heme sensor protein HssS [Jeotgalicoccus coquinae]